MEHLALEIFGLDGTGSQWAWLPEDASITITDTSEVFAKGDVWSHSFSLNVNANAHIFGTSGELHGSRLHDQIDRRRARLWVEGLPLFLGYLRLGDEAEVDEDGDVDVTFESGAKTFDDLIEGAKANQVPLMSDVKFGVALWRKRYVNAGLVLSIAAKLRDGGTTRPMVLYHGEGTFDGNNVTSFITDGEDDNVSTQDYPRMVFPKGEFLDADTGTAKPFNCLNVDQPYTEDPDDGQPLYPYCNVALCYQKQGYDKKMPDGSVQPDYTSEPEAQRGYEEMPANRVNSAPNFYVIYWLRCLMKHLGIVIEENQMMDVQDLRRLFMVNTKCAYKEPKKVRGTRTEEFDKKVGRYKFKNGSNGKPKRLVPEQFVPHDDPSEDPHSRWHARETFIKVEDCGFEVTEWDPNIIWEYDTSLDIKGFVVTTNLVAGLDETQKAEYEAKNNFLHDAYATSECFPDVDISEVIKALENGFGIRFLFSDDYQRVRIVLLKNLFNGTDVQDIDCDVTSDVKVENNIRGFRMTYGESEDTHFYYKGFNDMLPHQKTIWPDNSDTHDYSQWDLKADYKKLLNRVSAFDKTCYVTKNNGNAWGIKVDKNAKRYEDLHPSLFEYAGFMDAEDGDCSGDEETIEEISMGFKPAIMNDVNWEEERSSGTEEQRFALFVDEKMRPRRPDLAEENVDFNDPDAYYNVDTGLYGLDGNRNYKYVNMMDGGVVKPGEFAITSDMYATASRLYADITGPGPFSGVIGRVTGIKIEGHANEGYRLYLQDNFEPNDDGVSPIETHDWGLTLGIMRGSGSDASVAYEPDPDDGEGNDTWYNTSGSSITAHPDTCDNYGHIWDYNGGQEGTGGMEGRFSLKLRAEKPNPKFDPTKPESSTNKRYLDITNADLRRRGLCDQFYTEYSYWVRNARIAKRTVRMELAQLLALDKTKKVRVGDIQGFVRKMQYAVSNKTGLGEVTMEIMYI